VHASTLRDYTLVHDAGPIEIGLVIAYFLLRRRFLSLRVGATSIDVPMTQSDADTAALNFIKTLEKAKNDRNLIKTKENS
jgi:hypothetical protein